MPSPASTNTQSSVKNVIGIPSHPNVPAVAAKAANTGAAMRGALRRNRNTISTTRATSETPSSRNVADVKRLLVYDALGHMVYARVGLESASMDVGFMNRGVYVVKVETSHGLVTQRIVKRE